jgi:hypothetical protein
MVFSMSGAEYSFLKTKLQMVSFKPSGKEFPNGFK